MRQIEPRSRGPTNLDFLSNADLEEIVHSGGHVLNGIGDEVDVIGTLASWEHNIRSVPVDSTPRCVV